MGIKWQTKYKKQPCKVYEGEELMKLATSMGCSVDLEKREADAIRNCKHKGSIVVSDSIATCLFTATCTRCQKSAGGHKSIKAAKAALKS